jgi:hypothetical protein
MDWKCASSNRAPALQAQRPEFKPQSHKNKMKQTKLPSVLHSAKELARDSYGLGSNDVQTTEPLIIC